MAWIRGHNFRSLRRAAITAAIALLATGIVEVQLAPPAVSVDNNAGNENAYVAAVMLDQPISWWRMDETSGPVDDHVGTSDGSVNGNPGRGQPGFLAGSESMYFPGRSNKSWVSIQNPQNIQPANTITIESWFKCDPGTCGQPDDNWPMIFRWRFFGYALLLIGMVPVGEVNATGSGSSVSATTPIADTKWHHMAVTRSSTTLSLYVDGGLVASTPTTGSIKYTSGGGTAIARDGAHDSDYFQGYIDELAIYNYALGADRIAAHWLAGGGHAISRPPAEMTGVRPNQNVSGDPVDTASGNFLHQELDLVPEDGAFGLEWSRTYNSRGALPSTIGTGWTTAFSDRVSIAPSGAAVLTKADGRTVTFPASGGTFTRPADEYANLERLADNSWRLSWFEGETWTFDATGKLTTKANWTGETATAGYSASGVLQTITSSTGPTLTLGYDGSGRLSTVTSSDGRVVTYTYHPTNGTLATATTPLTGTTTYGADSGNRLASVTDAAGKNIVTNVYDTSSRVISQTSGSGGSTTTFVYDDLAGTTVMSDGATGQTLTYTHDAMGRLLSAKDPANKTLTNSYDSVTGDLESTVNRWGASASQDYDAHGNIVSSTDTTGVTRTATYDTSDRLLTSFDPASGTTTYTYTGSNRLPTTVTNALGKTTTYEITNGLVTKETDADGVVTAYSYDASRRLQSTTVAPGTPLAATSSQTYDAAGRVLTRTNPLNQTVTYVYDANGRLQSETDPLSHSTSYTYDAAGRVLTKTDATGKVTTNTYDSSGRLATTTSPRGLTTTFGYDTLGQHTSTTHPGGATTETAYGILGRPTSTTDELDRVTTYSYNRDGNQTFTLDPTGASYGNAYDFTTGRPSTFIDGNGRGAGTFYDTAGRVSMTTTIGDATTNHQYDGAGRVWKVINPRGAVTETLYTDAGRLLSTKTPENVTTTNTYDAAGRLWKETTPLGSTIHEYDLAGREIRTTTPGGQLTQRSYDAAGRLTTVTDPAGVVTTYTYTDRNEKASETKTGTGTTSFTYDPDGNLATVTDPLGHITTFGYDNRNRRTTQTDAAGKTTTWAHDDAGQLTSRTDPLGRATTFTYDGMGRAKTSSDPSGRTVTRTYDAAGQLTGLAYGDGSTVTMTYDQFGYLASATDPSGTTSYTHDSTGNLTNVVRPNGRITSYTYDTAGRRTKLTLPDGSGFAYAYDSMSRLASITPTAALADTFTAPDGSAMDPGKWSGGPVTGTTRAVQSNAMQMTTTGPRIALNSLSGIVVDSEVSLKYQFGDLDPGGNLEVRLRDNTGSYVLTVRNDSSTVTLSKLVAGVFTTLGTFTASTTDTNWHGVRFRVVGSAIKARLWDAASAEPSTWNLDITDTAVTAAGTMRIAIANTTGSHTLRVDDVVYTKPSNPPTAIATFGYDADSNVVSETLGSATNTRAWTWTGGRVTSMTQTLVPQGTRTTNLTYDSSGRIASESLNGAVPTTYSYDAASQLTTVAAPGVGPVTYAYDTRGRRTTMTSSAGATTTYAHDDAGQLASSTVGGVTTSYAYDAAGRRLSETSGASTLVSYTYDAAGRLASHTRGATTQARTYDPKGSLIGVANTTAGTTTRSSLDWDEALAMPELAMIQGTTAAAIFEGPAGHAAFYRVAGAIPMAVDVHGSPIAINNTLVARAQSYDVFGVPSGTATFDPKVGYRGELMLDGMLHLRARSYQPATGLFLTVDPLEATAGETTVANPYHYASNNPLNRVDPSGLRPGQSPFVGGDSALKCPKGQRGIQGVCVDVAALNGAAAGTRPAWNGLTFFGLCANLSASVPNIGPVTKNFPAFLKVIKKWFHISMTGYGCLLDDGNELAVAGALHYSGVSITNGASIAGAAGWVVTNAPTLDDYRGWFWCLGASGTYRNVVMGAEICFGFKGPEVPPFSKSPNARLNGVWSAGPEVGLSTSKAGGEAHSSYGEWGATVIWDHKDIRGSKTWPDLIKELAKQFPREVVHELAEFGVQVITGAACTLTARLIC